jgi:hypothetical protein
MSGITTMPSWQAHTRQVHIMKVAVIMSVLFLVIGVVVAGLVYPKCNPSQVHGFFTCACPPGSAMDTATGMCTCLNNGTTLGNMCEEGSASVRYVFEAQGIQPNWTFTQGT